MYSHQLDAFVKAAELGSFGKAAEAMYISAPAMIQQINLLEARCGFSLFVRTNHGVTLTPAGKSLYEDAKTIIRLSADALDRARHIAESRRSTVRIGTSLLFKCRLFPDIWSKIGPRCPDLRIEILPLAEDDRRFRLFDGLGSKYDLVEGVYGSIAYAGLCDFLELMRTPICCAVSGKHRLSARKSISFDDLGGETLVFPVENVSGELDELRREIVLRFPDIRIIDSNCYGVDTFAMCEVDPYVLITQKVYSDIHPDLVTIPLEPERAMPYGIMYSKTPSDEVKKFIDAISEIL